MSRGQYNSSKTRVCPAFRVIKENPEPFFNLLHDKLGLNIEGLDMGDVTIKFADPEKEKKERPLNPNPMYLKWAATLTPSNNDWLSNGEIRFPIASYDTKTDLEYVRDHFNALKIQPDSWK